MPIPNEKEPERQAATEGDGRRSSSVRRFCSPVSNERPVDHDYALTGHALQGATVERAIVLLGDQGALQSGVTSPALAPEGKPALPRKPKLEPVAHGREPNVDGTPERLARPLSGSAAEPLARRSAPIDEGPRPGANVNSHSGGHAPSSDSQMRSRGSTGSAGGPAADAAPSSDPEWPAARGATPCRQKVHRANLRTEDRAAARRPRFSSVHQQKQRTPQQLGQPRPQPTRRDRRCRPRPPRRRPRPPRLQPLRRNTAPPALALLRVRRLSVCARPRRSPPAPARPPSRTQTGRRDSGEQPRRQQAKTPDELRC